MSVQWEIKDNEVDKSLSSKAEGLDTKTVLALEGAIMALFAETQMTVHVITGRLRASGRVNSHIRNDVWTGEITYGNRIAYYAGYEAGKGYQHDFMPAGFGDKEIGVAFRVGLED